MFNLLILQIKLSIPTCLLARKVFILDGSYRIELILSYEIFTLALDLKINQFKLDMNNVND